MQQICDDFSKKSNRLDDDVRSQNTPLSGNGNDDGEDQRDRDDLGRQLEDYADFRQQRHQPPSTASNFPNALELFASHRDDSTIDGIDRAIVGTGDSEALYQPEGDDETVADLKSSSFSPVSSVTDAADVDGEGRCRRSKPSPSGSVGSEDGGRKQQLLLIPEGDVDLTGEDYDHDESDEVREARQRQMYARFQAWALRNYGEAGKTKTVTRAKYDRIVAILSGCEPPTADNSKLRFWVKAKGFRLNVSAMHDAVGGVLSSVDESRLSTVGCRNVLFVPAKNWGGSYDDQAEGVNVCGAGRSTSTPRLKRVAVVEDFFQIIYGVHVEMDGRGGKHAGQKRTYRAIAETYAFLPREAVTKFLMSCADCQKRMHLTMDNYGVVHTKGGYQTKLGQRASRDGGTEQHAYGGRTGNHRNFSGTVGYRRGRLAAGNNHPLMTITDYNLPITVTYLNYLKQRKRRRPRACQSLAIGRKRSKMAAVVDPSDVSSQQWTCNQFGKETPTFGLQPDGRSTALFEDVASAHLQDVSTDTVTTSVQHNGNRSFYEMVVASEVAAAAVVDNYSSTIKDDPLDNNIDDDDDVESTPIDLSVASRTPCSSEQNITAFANSTIQCHDDYRVESVAVSAKSASSVSACPDVVLSPSATESDVGESTHDDDITYQNGIAAMSPTESRRRYSTSPTPSDHSNVRTGAADINDNTDCSITDDVTDSQTQSTTPSGIGLLLTPQSVNMTRKYPTRQSEALQTTPAVGANAPSPKSPRLFIGSKPTTPTYLGPAATDAAAAACLSTSSNMTTFGGRVASPFVASEANSWLLQRPGSYDVNTLNDAIALAAAATAAVATFARPSGSSRREPSSTVSADVRVQTPSAAGPATADSTSSSSTVPTASGVPRGDGSIGRRYQSFTVNGLLGPDVKMAAAIGQHSWPVGDGLTSENGVSVQTPLPLTRYSSDACCLSTAEARSYNNNNSGGRACPSVDNKPANVCSSPMAANVLSRYMSAADASIPLPSGTSPFGILAETAAVTPAHSGSARRHHHHHHNQQQQQQPHPPVYPAVPAATSAYRLDGLAAVRQIIAGYRDSAAFLCHSADELEYLLQLQLQQQPHASAAI